MESAHHVLKNIDLERLDYDTDNKARKIAIRYSLEL